MTTNGAPGPGTGPEPATDREDSEECPEDTERHAFDLGIWWDVYFTAVMVGVVVLALLTGPAEWRWLTAALVSSVVALHFGLLRPYARDDGSPPAWLGRFGVSGLVLVLTLPAVILNPALTWMVIGVAPLCFMTVGSLFAVPLMGVLLLFPSLLRGLFGLEEWSGVGLTFLINGLLLGYALWFGTWFERIVEQSWERYSLIERLRRSQEEAALLSEQAGAMAERERLAREMHDTLAQGFTSIITLTQAVESELDTDPATARRHLALMRETAAENLAEARAMVAARQAVPLQGDDLDGALTRISERLGRELGIEVAAHVTGSPEELPNDLRVCLLRTAQEALANVRKHADAGHTRVTLAYTDVGVALTVADDGRGFDTARPSDGNGLANMRHRAEAVGGVLDLESTPGGGTTVRLTIPHDDHEDADE
ncbi:sensor histidine kinase [Nocardiopsis ganjiahuensis]|uniref:sensor histidine kinase n=1 Tax=Nocardiopsis ganjiahuensis TaxID=239984 RepID=UPI00034B2604|nr:sensor histidine kinase [Nocardiopsis ganjiahuensis]